MELALILAALYGILITFVAYLHVFETDESQHNSTKEDLSHLGKKLPEVFPSSPSSQFTPDSIYDIYVDLEGDAYKILWTEPENDEEWEFMLEGALIRELNGLATWAGES